MLDILTSGTILLLPKSQIKFKCPKHHVATLLGDFYKNSPSNLTWIRRHLVMGLHLITAGTEVTGQFLHLFGMLFLAKIHLSEELNYQFDTQNSGLWYC